MRVGKSKHEKTTLVYNRVYKTHSAHLAIKYIGKIVET